MPGLITIAAMYGAFMSVAPRLLPAPNMELKGLGDAAFLGIGVAVMVLTQAIGILVEKAFTSKKLMLYGGEEYDIEIPEGVDPVDPRERNETMYPYCEYNGLYLLLAEMGEHEDTQGHLQRAVAQFFLTPNTLVSFTLGLVATAVLGGIAGSERPWLGLAYAGLMGVCMIISYEVARIRFTVMARALWAARRRRIADKPAHPTDVQLTEE